MLNKARKQNEDERNKKQDKQERKDYK